MMGQKNALYFCAGLAIGILGTLGFLWFYQEPEKKPEQHIDIPESPEETQHPNADGKSSLDDLTYPQPQERVDYATIVNAIGYGKNETSANEDILQHELEPHRISEEQFEEGNIDGHYDICELTLYGNGVLADSTSDEVMSESDAFAALGPNYTARRLHEIFERALDYSDDSILIRNNQLFTQYEITYDKRGYQEVTGRYPDGSYGA